MSEDNLYWTRKLENLRRERAEESKPTVADTVSEFNNNHPFLTGLLASGIFYMLKDAFTKK